MMRWLFQWSTSGQGLVLSTLIFHRVLPQPDPLLGDEMHAARFDRICGWLREWFHVLPLDEACRRLADGSLPPRALALSFDDGYADNHDVALPILRRHGLSATFFVSTGFLDGGRMWNDCLIEAVRMMPGDACDFDRFGVPSTGVLPLGLLGERRSAVAALLSHCKHLPQNERDAVVAGVCAAVGRPLPLGPMMRPAQVRALAEAGMGVGAHTVSHPILAKLPAAHARHEIVAGRDALQQILDRPVTLFAYPNGVEGDDFLPEHVQMVRDAGFAFAFTTQWGTARRATDRLRMPRFTPWDQTRWRFGLRMWRNIVAPQQAPRRTQLEPRGT